MAWPLRGEGIPNGRQVQDEAIDRGFALEGFDGGEYFLCAIWAVNFDGLGAGMDLTNDLVVLMVANRSRTNHR